MLSDLEEASRLSEMYDIPTEDIMLMDMNSVGARSSLPNDRVRFFMKLHTFPEYFYFALPLNQAPSQFSLSAEKSKVLFNNQPIGDVIGLENDDCTHSYFRRNGTALTLNSNARSLCRGCAFCGTYSLEADDHEVLKTKNNLTTGLRKIIKGQGMEDMSKIHELGIVTGCFNSEDAAVQHLILVNEAAQEIGFSGELKYVGCEVKTEESLDKIKDSIPSFGYSLTVECFTRREELMKPLKFQVTLEKGRKILDAANRRGFQTTFLYILGLDPLEVIDTEFRNYVPHLTRFPVINLLQPYKQEQNMLRTPEAWNIEYFLKARKVVEGIFGPSGLRPRPWENYRSAWYLKFGGEDIHDIRI